MGSLFVVAAYAVAQTAAGADLASAGPLYPVVYLVMAFLVAFMRRGVGLALVGFALALEAAALAAAGLHGHYTSGTVGFLGTIVPVAALAPAAAHAGFIVLF